MAAFALTYAYVSIGGNDISAYVKSTTLNVGGNAVDVTAMSSTAWQSFVAGLKNWTVDVTANTDVAASALDSILWSLYSTSVAVELRATGSAVGTSNPKWTGSGILLPGSIFGGSVGAASETSFTVQGSGALTRATS